MKKWPRAVEYPEFVAVAVGFEVQLVKEHWPEMKEFLQECYKEGAPQNAKVKEILEKGGAGGLQEKPQDKPGELAPPEGKAAPKGDAAGEAKKDEAKGGEGDKKEAAPAGKGGEKAPEKAPVEGTKAGQ
jgi:hypothetical protein